MRLEKREVSKRKSVGTSHCGRVEDLVSQAWSDDLRIRRRLCNFLIVMFALGMGVSGTLIVLHGAGIILLPSTVLTALIIVAFGAAPRMLGKIVKAAFKL